ncbi:Phosphate-import permease protein PhnE [Candidatus Izimaplasma bacterium HR1]|jgi:phosphonate transport system permease protein|uniref:PhnE/PtxC family ABC transporter permease n=1 Tax=Candidatus Izimoplasma sp. HR1 TaxID=1541959 RepID=UPI0004F73C89|nr:Phosphate-import permease protein PhnE [Candidatus Izimaplasma bacterium HR1]
MNNPSDQVLNALYAYPRLSKTKIASIIIVSLLVLWSIFGISYVGLNEKGITVAVRLVQSFFTPNKTILFGDNAYSVQVLGLETIAIAFLGTIFGAILAIPVAFLAARNIMPKAINLFFQGGITGIRVFPAFVIGVAIIRVTGLGPFAGVLTMGITSIGMMTKLYVEAVEGINHNVLDAMDATGCTTFQKIRFGIIPQLTAQFLSTAIYRFEINVKNAAVLGLVGAGGIGGPLLNAISAGRFSDASAYLIGLAVMVLIIEFFSNFIRGKLA